MPDPEAVAFVEAARILGGQPFSSSIRQNMPDPSRNTRDGSASTKTPDTEAVAFVEPAHILGGQLFSSSIKEDDALPSELLR
jgi:hypothetical protein